jgi:chemotaxis protein MotB
MGDPSNPFASPEPPTQTISRGALVAWSLAAVMTVVALLFLLLWSQSQTRHQRELEVLHTTLREMTTNLTRASAWQQTNQDLIASLQHQNAALQLEKDLTGQMAKSLEDEMRAKLESKDVTISQLQGKLTVTIVDRVMFDSGEATLKPDGAAVMQKIAALLAAHPELKIHVIGHTDNVPIRPTAQTRFASNWELSTARALAAVHFLTEKAGVDPRRVGAVGYGEFRPIADNATAEGRAKNRRIAITILPGELAAADTGPAPGAKEPTNSVPLSALETPER